MCQYQMMMFGIPNFYLNGSGALAYKLAVTTGVVRFQVKKGIGIKKA